MISRELFTLEDAFASDGGISMICSSDEHALLRCRAESSHASSLSIRRRQFLISTTTTSRILPSVGHSSLTNASINSLIVPIMMHL
ncbi:hypothetical protein KIN20_010405 [Parelaphostrongylus tenuis]|uniref:Uncharacterized protein n=1 Tax=Parelaphostrongylus tenuis TaxID=148309 RepID=A0AAD5QLE1_PARTN|nr:hypothetical protein KIN20_010405 [Parelaphostrongylus tenuis]